MGHQEVQAKVCGGPGQIGQPGPDQGRPGGPGQGGPHRRPSQGGGHNAQQQYQLHRLEHFQWKWI